MSPKEKKRYIMLTLILRDLNLLQKCLIYSGNKKSSEEPLVSATTTISFFFLKTLISKIHEMWTFLNRNEILDNHSTFSNELKAKRDEIQKFFSDNKVEEIFSFIRNKFGFHYEYLDDVDLLIDEGMESFDQLEIWLSTWDSGNEIFASSNALVLSVIFRKMSNLGFEGDEKNLMDKIFDLALDAARIFREFSVSYIVEAFSINWRQEEEIEIDVPSISEVHLPLIVKGE
ncbi:MAG: hypothetical protein JRJ38_20540 [Deltaproteobacteria bacterium]|nr:hypothetical protein [Deltaproteobacteria bacterium]